MANVGRAWTIAVLLLALMASALGAPSSRRLLGDDAVLQVEVNGELVDVFAAGTTALGTTTTAFASQLDDPSSLTTTAKPPPPPAPAPAPAIGAAPGGGRKDISYQQMGLIIGLVVGTLFLAAVAVCGYIIWDLSKSRRSRWQRERQLSASGASGTSNRETMLEAEAEAEAAHNQPGLPSGQNWLSVHDGIVGLELEDTPPHSGGEGGGSATNGHNSPAGGGLGGAVAALLHSVRRSVGGMFGPDWRTRLSRPLKPALKEDGWESERGSGSSSGSGSGGAVVVAAAGVMETPQRTRVARSGASALAESAVELPLAALGGGGDTPPPPPQRAPAAAAAVGTEVEASDCGGDMTSGVGSVGSTPGTSGGGSCRAEDGHCVVGVGLDGPAGGAAAAGLAAAALAAAAGHVQLASKAKALASSLAAEAVQVVAAKAAVKAAPAVGAAQEEAHLAAPAAAAVRESVVNLYPA